MEKKVDYWGDIFAILNFFAAGVNVCVGLME